MSGNERLLSDEINSIIVKVQLGKIWSQDAAVRIAKLTRAATLKDFVEKLEQYADDETLVDGITDKPVRCYFIEQPELDQILIELKAVLPEPRQSEKTNE